MEQTTDLCDRIILCSATTRVCFVLQSARR
jgi:hypothetical protein